MAGHAGSADSIYKVVEVIGTSTKSWEIRQRMRWRPLLVRCGICGLPRLRRWT